MIKKGRVTTLKKTHNKLRKDGGDALQQFLDAPFAYPVVSQCTPRAAVDQRQLDGLADVKTLRSQNLELHAELTETKDHLKCEEKKTSDLTKERELTKRKLERYEEMMKKKKAEHEKAVYWQGLVNEQQTDAAASAKLKEVERKNSHLQQEVKQLEIQKEEIRQNLEETLTDKVIIIEALIK